MASKTYKSTSGKKSDLKANNAKSSRTSKGVTSYYSSGKDIDAGKAPIKQTKAGSNVALTPENLAPATPATIPEAPQPKDIGDIVTSNNTGLASMLGYTIDAKGQFQAPKETAGTSADTSGMANIFSQYISSKAAPPELSSIYDQEAKNAGLKQKQNDVNNYTSQLNSIVAKQQSDLLRLRGTGSEQGVTEAVYGGQQATINREAAIAALPVQAALASAQGNLELAQSHVDKMFQIKSQDATAKYNYRNSLLDSVYQFATTAEQTRLNALKTKEDRTYQQQQTNLQLANQWAMQAIEYGQSGLAQRFMSIDTSSPTFQQDFARLQGQVSKPVPAVTPKAPDLQNFGTSDAPIWKQYNPATGAWEDPSGVTAPTQSNDMSNAITRSNIDQIESLISNNYLSGAVGPNSLARFSPTSFFTGGKSDVVASVEQLRGQLTLDSLINAKARGATFGALSEGELKILSASASKIGTWAQKDGDGNVVSYKTSEKEFKKELDKINNLAKLDYVLKGGSPVDVGVRMQLDGTLWTQNSDGTYAQIR